MSWHFSQALAAAYSVGNCSDGKPSAPSSGTDTPATYCSHGKTTGASKPSRSGMTCKLLTDEHGEAVLTWFRAGFPVRTFPPLARVPESTESGAGCGGTWPESLARWDRVSSSWKTPQCSLLAGLDEFSETWPRWGMMRAGECWAQSMPAHLTSESESGLLPTPSASCDSKPIPVWNEKSQSGRSLGTRARLNFWPTIRSTSGDGLATAVKMWQTPVADDAVDRVRGKVNSRGEPKLSAEVKMWPTPTVQDSKNNGAPSQMERNTKPLNAEVGGSLNPTWVEWLMGFPLAWTDYAVSGTHKFRQWRRSHGEF